MAIDALSSPSRERRLRNNATKRRLWEAANSPPVVKTESQFIVATERLDQIETMLSQLHWCLIGQWAVYSSCYQDMSASSAGTAQNFNFKGNPETTCSVPERSDVVSSYKLWQPGDHRALFLKGTPMGEQLRHEAAICIQAMVRKRVLQNDCERSEQSSNKGDTQPCAGCGLKVILDGRNSNGEYDCDMCDKCDSVLHTSCLNGFSNLQGDWCLCKSCLLEIRSGKGIQAIACDSRCLPTDSWRNIHALFQQARARDEDASDEMGEDRKHQIETEFQTTLDYVLKFLEGMHVKSGKITQQQRADMLQMVKSAMSWKQPGRTHEEIKDNIAKIDDVMMRMVRGL